MTSTSQSRLGIVPAEAVKSPVDAATDLQITLFGEQTIAGTSVVSGDRVLVKDQASSTENGIYNVSNTTWTRAKDWNGAKDVVNGVLVLTTDTGTLYRADVLASGEFNVGSTSVTFSTLPGIVLSPIVTEEIAATASQTIFTSSNPVIEGSTLVYVDGVLISPSAYTVLPDGYSIEFLVGQTGGAIVTFQTINSSSTPSTTDAAAISYTPVGGSTISVEEALDSTVSEVSLTGDVTGTSVRSGNILTVNTTVDIPNASVIPYTPAGTATVATTVEAALRANPVRQYNTLALAIADVSNISVGDVLVLKERVSGSGGGATWDAVLASSVVENGYDIVVGDSDTSLVLRYGSSVKSSQLGLQTGVTDSTGVQFLADLLSTIDEIVFDTSPSVDARITIPIENDKTVRFTNGSYVTQTSDNIVFQFGDGTFGISQLVNWNIYNLRVVTAGYGQDNAGLININNSKDIYFYNTRIYSDNAQAQSLSAVYNGISISVNSENIVFRDTVIEGTPKSGVHISSGSNKIRFYNTKITATGNHDTATYGYTPALDCQANDSIIDGLYSIDAQGEVLLINAEHTVVAGWGTFIDESKRSVYKNIVGENCGTNGIRTATFDNGYVPTDFTVEDVFINGCAESGVLVGASLRGKFNRVRIKDTQFHGAYLGSSTEVIDADFTNTIIENWLLSDNAAYSGVSFGTSDRVSFNNTKFVHDAVGITVTPVAWGATGSKTIDRVDIESFFLSGTITDFGWFSIPTAGHFSWSALGAPSAGSQAPNGSTYSREDGVGTTDNFYIRRGGAWVGVH